MKQIIAATVLVGISNLAIAADTAQMRHRFTEYANVIAVDPVFKRVRYEKPQKECWIEQEEHVVIREGSSQSYRANRQSRSSSNNGGAIIGGLIGGVIGNQIGRGGSRSTRNGATVAGAIVGSVIANEASGSDVTRHRRQSNNNRRVESRQPQRVVTTRPVERCRETTQTSYENQVQAYDVTYEYRGQSFTTRMNRDPGNRIELQVNVAPARQ